MLALLSFTFECPEAEGPRLLTRSPELTGQAPGKIPESPSEFREQAARMVIETS